MEQKEKSVLTERKKIFTRCIAIISVAAAVLIIMLPYKQDNSTAAYEELLSEELKALKHFYGIQSASQAPEYVERDADDFNVYCREVQEFSLWGERNHDARFRFVTETDGQIYLGYVSYKNDEDTFYVIMYNTNKDTYSVEKYTSYVIERTRRISKNIKWMYSEVYLADQSGDKFYLYGSKSVDSLYYGEATASFAEWANKYKGKNDDYVINLSQEGSRKIMTDIKKFLKSIKADEQVADSCEYRYFSKTDGKRGVCSVCYADNQYYYMVYFPTEDWYEFYVYDNLYEIKNKDGSVSYVLSNLQKDAEYAVNNVNSENVSEYLYIVADDE